MATEILKGVGKFFIALAYLCIATISIIFLRDVSVRVTGLMLTLTNGLTLLAVLVYLVAAVPIMIYLFAGKKKEEAHETQSDIMSYVSDIYVNVNKNTETLNAIVEYLQSTQQQPDEPAQK